MEFHRCFEVAGGSVVGTAHGRIGRNNQDAWAVRAGPEGVVAIVADGCGSGGSSEVGARLGATLLAEGLLRRLRWPDPARPFGEAEAATLLEGARQDLLAHLARLAIDLSRQDHRPSTGPWTVEKCPTSTFPARPPAEGKGDGPTGSWPGPTPEDLLAAMGDPLPKDLARDTLAGDDGRSGPAAVPAVAPTADARTSGLTAAACRPGGAPAPGNGRGSTLAVPVGEFFLFTVVGFLATRTTAVAFHGGDGVLAWNGEITVWQALRNAPAYPAYELTGSSLQGLQPDAFRFAIDRCLSVDRLDSLLIGTDGVTDWLAAAAESFPGTTEPIGPLSRFWEDDTLFANPDALRRRLFRANQAHQRADWEGRRLHRIPGRLPDDTTLVVIRRRREGQA